MVRKLVSAAVAALATQEPALALLSHQINAVTQYWPLVLGSVLLLLLFVFPGGIMGLRNKRRA